jgi:multicomponent Na+:H+ antiporter subunit B
MQTLINLVIECFLVLTAIAAVRTRDLFAIVMLFGIYSFLTALWFMDLDAVDVAFTEAAVGAGISTVLMLSTLRLVGRYQKPAVHKPWIPLLVVCITGAALVYGVLDAPEFGDPNAPIHLHVAPRYIEQSPTEIGVPNMVTSILASYRGYDTLGETVVIFTAGLAVLLLLGVREGQNSRAPRVAIGDLLVLRVVVKVMIAFILLYALYVQMHGDYGAGGGFQAGVIFATGFIIYDLVFGETDARLVLPSRWLSRLAALGIFIYGGVGVVCMLAGKTYLDYSALAHDPVHGQHLGILLVELGVGITVYSIILTIFYAFSGLRRPGIER